MASGKAFKQYKKQLQQFMANGAKVSHKLAKQMYNTGVTIGDVKRAQNEKTNNPDQARGTASVKDKL